MRSVCTFVRLPYHVVAGLLISCVHAYTTQSALAPAIRLVIHSLQGQFNISIRIYINLIYINPIPSLYSYMCVIKIVNLKA